MARGSVGLRDATEASSLAPSLLAQRGARTGSAAPALEQPSSGPRDSDVDEADTAAPNADTAAVTGPVDAATLPAAAGSTHSSIALVNSGGVTQLLRAVLPQATCLQLPALLEAALFGGLLFPRSASTGIVPFHNGVQCAAALVARASC